MRLISVYSLWKSSFTGIPRSVWLLTLINFVNRVGAMVLAFLPLYLTQHMHFGIVEAGYVMTCFGFGSVAGNFVGGKLTDTLGFYRVQLLSLVLNGVVLMVMGYLDTIVQLGVSVFSLALVADMFRPANSTAIGHYSTAETRTRSFSLMRLAFNLGWTVCPALGGILIYNFGWHITFWIDGITCILAALTLFLLLRETGGGGPRAGAKIKSAPATLSPYRDKWFLFFALLTFLNAFSFMQILWTLPVYFKELLYFNEAQVGTFMAVNGLIVALVEMPLVYNIEKKRSLFHWIGLGLIFYAISYFALLLPLWGIITATICIVGLSFGEILVMPFSSNFAITRAGANSHGQYMALYSIAYSIANILAPSLGTQIIAAWGYNALWAIVGGTSVLSLIGIRWMSTHVRLNNQH